MKTNILNSYCIGFDKVMSRTFLRLDSLSILSRQSVLAIFVACLTVLGVGNAWGAAVPSKAPADGKQFIIAMYDASADKYYALYHLDEDGGLYCGEECTLNGSNQVTAIADETSPIDCLWFFESTGTANEYYISFDNSGTKMYLYKNGTTGDNYKIKATDDYKSNSKWLFKSGTANGVTTYSVKTTKSGATKHTVLRGETDEECSFFCVEGTDDAFEITLLEIVPRTVTFNAQGGSFDDPSIFVNTNQITEALGGAGITLPLANPSASCISEGWAFYGWATAPCSSSTTTAPAIVGQAGDTYYPVNNSTTLHAVYAKGEYTKITSTDDLNETDKYFFAAIYSTKNYIMTDHFESDKLAAKQIDETSTGKYHAGKIIPSWCYTLEAESSNWHIVDCNSANTNHYMDVTYSSAWYGHSKNASDPYTFVYSSDHWEITNIGTGTNKSFGYYSTDNTFKQYTTAQNILIYKVTSTPYYYSNPSCCEYEVSVSESGSSHISSMAFSESSVATCGDASSRTITITVTPASGYSLFGSTKPVFTWTSGTVTATIGSVTDNGDGTFSYECTFNSNDNGAGTFAISPGQFTNYRTLCCAKYDITLADSGAPTGGLFAVTDGDKDITEACGSTALELEAVAEKGYEFSTWAITKTSNGADAWDDVKDTGEATDDNIIIAMPDYAITVSAAFACTEPTISAQPSSASYTQGDAATALSVSATAGTGTVDYQWQSSSDNSSWDDIDKETSSTYTPSTTSTGTMYYRVVVTNHECSESVESDAATVVVSAPSVCKTPTFSVSAGTYSSAQSVELSCGTDGATIRYTTNGDDPTESSSVYSSAISVSVNTTIKAKAFKAGLDASDVASATYNIRCAAPTFSLSDYGEYVGSQSLTMSSGTAGATIRYTTDDTEPTALSTAYSTAITVAGTSTIRAKAFKDGMTESEEAEVNVFIYCATPTFSVSAGTYNANQSVSISTTYGTTIYYTLDGSTPDTESSVYSTDITIDATKTLKAIAVKDGCENSEVASATYTLKCVTPTFSPAAGTYTGAQSVSMSCATDGSAIHYTTNGTDPTGSSTTYSSAISVGTNQTVKAIATKTGWSDSEVASAAYTIKYIVAVASVENVTISATTPSVAAGSSAAAEYGSTVSLSYSGVASGKTWGGWNVYKTDDASTKVVVTNNQFTMPDYNVTVSAYLYGDAIAWCDPKITIDGDVHLTSYNGIPVYATSGADNLIEISSSDFGSATRLEVAYLDADNADAEVDKAESVFRFCSSSDYSTIDGMDLDYEWGTTHSIRYTPNAYNKRDNYKLQLILKRGDKVLKTVNYNIYGRALPQEFVIAVKNTSDNKWYALPSNLATTNAQPSIVPQVITVNNTTTPTAATYVPTTAVYKAKSSGSAAHVSTLRFTTTGSNYLQVSSTPSTYNMWLSTSTSANVQDWQLKSSDFNSYELTIPSTSATKKMGMYSSNTYMGYHGSPDNASIYLLPITNKYTEIAATVSEWGEHGVVVQPSTPSDLTGVASATMNIDDASPSTATTTAVNAAMGTAKRVRVYDDDGDLTVGAVANEGKLLYIHWKNSGGSEIGISQITIPTVIAASSDMSGIADTKAKWAAKSEIHVLPGVTLTADANTFAGVGALSVSNLHIYPGATLNVSTGTFNATTLRLHNGWTRAGEKAYDVARVYIADDAALTKTTASMDYDIYELTDGQHYYPLAVPFPVAVSAIDYADSWLAGYSTYGMSGQYVIKEYDGARRAEKGPDQQNNWRVVNDDATLSPSKGYIMAAVPVYGEAIIRIPLTFDNAWTADGELGTVSAVTKNVVAVTAYEGSATADDKKVNKGWNLLGVPFMSCYATDKVGNKDAIIQGRYDFNTNTWIDGTIRYVNVPSHDFAEYIQSDVTDPETVLRPGWCFMVQIDKDGNLTFMTAGEAENSSLPIYAPKRGMKADMPTVKTGIILSDGEKSDKTTFLVSDKYNGAEYEINADLEKLFGNGYTLATYSISGETRLAYNAMSNADAANIIPIGYRAPAEGEYTFSINPRYAQNGAFESVNLIDYETGIVTDLLQSSYTFSTERTQNDARFALNVVPRQETPTDLEDVQGDDVQGTKVRKMIINDQLFIIRDGQMYDATGRMVK